MAIGGNSKAKQPARPPGRGTPGPRGPGIGRGGSRVSRNGGVGTGRGLGRSSGRPSGRPSERPPGRPPGRPSGRPSERPSGRSPGGRSFSSGASSSRVNAPGLNPKATQQKQKSSTGKTKQKTKTQKKGKVKDASMVSANFSSFLIYTVHDTKLR